jgi:enoyl-CoA hydratase
MAEPREHLLVERPLPGVVLATIDRPERRNALTDQLFSDLAELQREVDDDAEARALVVTGAGTAFCAGLDLDLAAELPAMAAEQYYRHQQRWAEATVGFTRMRTPVIAAVNGAASGAGLGIALAADIRICSTTARFNAAFIRIGLSAGDVGCSWALPRIVGLGRAMEILLTGRFVDADEALRIGLVSAAVAPEELLDRALATAGLIGANSPFGVQLSKEVVHTNVDAPSLAAALDLENRTQVLATRSPDMAEALAAFREKRTPVFGRA